MNNLNSTAKLVKEILEHYPEARNNDDILYLHTCELLGYNLNKPLWVFLINRKHTEVPPYETVRRTRQKVQAECPWLAGTERTTKARAKKEKEYRDFAKGSCIEGELENG